MKQNAWHILLIDDDKDLAEITRDMLQSYGYEVCKELRRVSQVPVIFASARTSEADKVTGLTIGGDDYLAKPYSLKKLLARVNALIRRTYGAGSRDMVYEV